MQAFTSFVNRQPSNKPFVFAYKGKYIVKVLKSTEGSAHVDAYYYVDSSQNLVDHDFEAGVPAAGQLTIEKTSHVTPGSTADFATELRAFLESVGLASINLQGGRAFNWYDAIAAYYMPNSMTLTNVGPQGMNDWLVSANENDSVVVLFNQRCLRVKKTSSTTCVIDLFNSCGSEHLSVFNITPHDDVFDVALPYVCQADGDISDTFNSVVDDFNESLGFASSAYTASRGVFDASIDFQAMQFGFEL